MMARTALLPIALLMLLAGCATTPYVDPTAIVESKRDVPTPVTWRPGERWRLQLEGPDGDPSIDVTMRITDRPTKTCLEGDWFALELVEEHVPQQARGLQWSYQVIGSNLSIDFSGWCHMGTFAGSLDHDRFVGRTVGGPFDGPGFRPRMVQAVHLPVDTAPHDD